MSRPALRARVEALLSADAASNSPLDSPTAIPARARGSNVPSGERQLAVEDEDTAG